MKFKSKIIIFICTFALLFSLLAVSCFALVEDLVTGNRYIPSTDPSVYPADPFYASASFSINGELCFFVEILPEGLVFYDSEEVQRYIFLNTLGWLRPDATPISVEFITFNVFTGSSEEYDILCSVLNDYVESDPDSFYNQIFNSISGAVFGEDELTPEQNLSLSLISTVLSISLVLLPVLLVIGFLLRCFRL